MGLIFGTLIEFNICGTSIRGVGLIHGGRIKGILRYDVSNSLIAVYFGHIKHSCLLYFCITILLE